MDCIKVTQEKVLWLDSVNMVMNFSVPQKQGISWPAGWLSSFQGRCGTTELGSFHGLVTLSVTWNKKSLSWIFYGFYWFDSPHSTFLTTISLKGLTQLFLCQQIEWASKKGYHMSMTICMVSWDCFSTSYCSVYWLWDSTTTQNISLLS